MRFFRESNNPILFATFATSLLEDVFPAVIYFPKMIAAFL
jgi:hypothetical protein